MKTEESTSVSLLRKELEYRNVTEKVCLDANKKKKMNKEKLFFHRGANKIKPTKSIIQTNPSMIFP